MRTRSGLFSGLVLHGILFAPLIAAEAAGQQRYEVVSLGRLPNSFSTVPFAINNLGEAVGWCQGPQTQLRAFVYRPSTGITELPPPPGFTEAFATDITDNGYIVGVASNGLGTPARLWRYRDGVYTFIPALGVSCIDPRANAVNSSGAVVGDMCGDAGLRIPFYFSDATGTISLAPFGINSAQDISDTGAVTGRSAAGPAYRWTLSGGLEPIGTLPSPYDDYAEGMAINESAEVAGRSAVGVPGPDPYRAFFSRPGGAVFEIAPTVLARSGATGLNELGHAVGNFGTESTPEQTAWLWTPERGTETLTTEFVSDPDFFGYRRAADINDLGQILAMGDQVEPQDPSVGVILTPVRPCAADMTGDGRLSLEDFVAFRNSYVAGDPRADFDGSGDLTLNDFFQFRNAYIAGCT